MLSYDDDALTLAITNPLQASNERCAGVRRWSGVNGGYGLTGMRERLLLIRGTLSAGADDGRWTVRARGSPMTDADERPLRIIVADDQASVREGLVLLLGMLPDIDVVASAANGEEALALVAQHRPDAILLDLHMPVLDGIETTARLTAEHPDVAIVILTTYSDDASVLAALRAGARSYLTKDADRTDIARALHAARQGLSVLDPAVQSDTSRRGRAPRRAGLVQPHRAARWAHSREKPRS